MLGHVPSAPLLPVDLRRGLFTSPAPKLSHFYLVSHRHMQLLKDSVFETRFRDCIGEQCFLTKHSRSDVYALIPGIAYQSNSPRMMRRIFGYIGLESFVESYPYLVQTSIELFMAAVVYVMSFSTAILVYIFLTNLGNSSSYVLLLATLSIFIGGFTVNIIIGSNARLFTMEDIFILLGWIGPSSEEDLSPQPPFLQ